MTVVRKVVARTTRLLCGGVRYMSTTSPASSSSPAVRKAINPNIVPISSSPTVTDRFRTSVVCDEPINYEDSLPGTVPVHSRHFVICTGLDSWSNKVEMMPGAVGDVATAIKAWSRTAMKKRRQQHPHHSHHPQHSQHQEGLTQEQLLEQIRIQQKTSTVAVTASNQQSRSKDGLDVLVFPDNIRISNVKADTVSDTLDRVLHPSVPGSLANVEELDTSDHRHIFVCTHGERDCRCGQIGNAVYDTIKRSLESSPELSKKLSVWRTSHLGGHKYAAVAVVYPPGDWFGRLTPENAPEFLSNLAGGKTPVDHWRGRVGLDKHEMVAMSKRLN